MEIDIYGMDPGTRVVVSINELQIMCERDHDLREIPEDAPYIDGEHVLEIDGVIDMFEYPGY